MSRIRKAHLGVITGPMFCGKSTELLRRLNISAEMGLKVLYINHSTDTRTVTPFSTHNPSIVSIGKITGIKIEGFDSIKDLDSWDVIGIDEAQFFTGDSDAYLRSHIQDWVENRNIHVIVAGLNGDSSRATFGQIPSLLPICDTWDLLSSFCVLCCKNGIHAPANFTKRIGDSSSVVDIGGKEKYVPVCRDCYLK